MKRLVSIFLFVACLSVVTLTSCRNATKYVAKPDLSDTVPEDPEQYDKELTVQDILGWHATDVRAAYLDSIWRALPDETIIAICITKGCYMSQYEMTEEYLKNKEFYDGYLKGVRDSKSKPSPIAVQLLPDKGTKTPVELDSVINTQKNE